MPKSSLSFAAIVTGRALLLAVSAAAVAVAWFAVRAPARTPPHASPGAAISYVCPMHADVVAASPGDCPICGMALAPAKRGPALTTAESRDRDTVVLPAPAAIATFDELGFGKRYEMARELRAPAWADTADVLQALFYRDEIALLGPTEDALFFPSTKMKDGVAPGLRAHRIDEPFVPWDDATALIRLRLDGKAKLPVGQTGWVKFPTRVRDMLAVRASAVIPSPAGPYVLLVADDKRTLTRRPIKIGSVLYEHAAVLSGLEVGERVAVLNTFFLDAERRLAGGPP